MNRRDFIAGGISLASVFALSRSSAQSHDPTGIYELDAGQRYDGVERSGSADLGKGWKTFIKRREGGYDLTFVIDMDFFKFDFRRTNRVKAQFYRWAEVQGMTEEESSWLGLGVHGEMGELVFGLE